MHVLLFVAANLLLAISTCSLLVLFPLPRAVDTWVTFFLLYVFQIMTVTFVLGEIGQLTLAALLTSHGVLTLVFGTLAWFRLRRTGAGSVNASLPRIRLKPLEWALVAFLGGLLLLDGLVGYILPPYAYDALAYHLVSVATWVQVHHIVDTPLSIWSNVYPKNAELVFTWLYVLMQNDSLVHLGQWIFGVGGVVATVAIARWMGLSRGASLLAGTLFFLAPTVFIQATTAYTDLAFAAVFLIFLYYDLQLIRNHDLKYAVLAGISAGILTGIKSTALLYVGIFALFLLGNHIRAVRRGQLTQAQVWQNAAAVILPLLLIGTYWYIHTWSVYGSPVYPFTVTLLGHSVFSGWGSVERLIMLPNTPQALLHKPWWQQVWMTWTGIPTYFSYDMQVGGFGVQWTLLEFPALVWLTLYTVIRDRPLFVHLVAPLLLIFVLQPANWWGRYTLFMPALGAWAFVYLASKVAPAWGRKLLYGLPVFVTLASFAAGAAVFASERSDVAKHVADSARAILDTPALDRTIGRTVYPEYHWVDNLSSAAKIGMSSGVKFPYPLFGRRLQNQVFLLKDATEQAFLRDVSKHHIQYMMLKDGDPCQAWIQQNSARFHLVWTYRNQYSVYSIQGENSQ